MVVGAQNTKKIFILYLYRHWVVYSISCAFLPFLLVRAKWQFVMAVLQSRTIPGTHKRCIASSVSTPVFYTKPDSCKS